MQEPLHTQPPIPSPVEPPASTITPTQEPRIWKEAPQIVKSVRLLTMLAIALLPLVAVGTFLMDGDAVEKAITAVIFGVFWLIAIYMLFALKAGTRAAWTVQLVLSILGLLSFPIGTIIHGYILFHWIKPETKAWFGVQ